MDKLYDVTALGEMLIDFTMNGQSDQGNNLFEACPGGAPCNVLAMLNKLGRKTAFIGKVGEDQFGRLLKSTIEELGIETRGLVLNKEVPTTLAFVHTFPDGDREFSFYRKPGADMMLTEDEVDFDLIRQSRVFHFGTLSMTDEPVKSATKKALKAAKEAGTEVAAVMQYCREHMDIKIKDDELENVAALKVAMKGLVEKYGCQAAAIQCWNQLQCELGIMPCAANALMNEEGIPVVCETDIHGAITALMVEAAGMGETRGFFADWTIRHPDIENGELLQHCGPWPMSVAQEKPKLTYPLAFEHPGSLTAEAKHGDVTLCRFDGDNGEYSLLLGNAKGVDGPKGMGTYLWVEVDNIKRLEAKIVEGPYIHHCVGIHKDVVPVLYEACKYIGVKPDLYDPIEEDVKAYLRGE